MAKSQELKKGNGGPHVDDDTTNDCKRATGKERQLLETKTQQRKVAI